MIITCSQCQAKFKVAPDQIKETGSKVRCSNCQYVFTVFRPRLPDEIDGLNPPLSSTGLKGLDDYLNSGGGDGPADDYGLGDIFGDRPAPRPDGRDLAESYEDPDDGLDEFNDIEDDGPHLRAAYKESDDQSDSMRERRDRRRRLYSDLADDQAPDGVDDDFDDQGFGDDELVGEDGLPPLRRTARSGYESADEGGGEDFDETDDPYDQDGQDDQYDQPDEIRDDFHDEQHPYDDEYDPQPGEGDDDEFYQTGAGEDDYSYESTRLARQVNDLGLSADPVDPDKFIDDTAAEGRYYGASESPSIRAAVTGPQGRSPVKLIVGLAVLALILGLGIYFIASRPATTALVDGETTGDQGGGDGGEEVDTAQNGDQSGTLGITFTRDKQSHYFRENIEAGNILIITGMVRNSYPDHRNFIRLRGHLLSEDGRTLADRYAYAGNVISEDELRSLSMTEIQSRLNIKGGQDGRNMNIESGQEIPFMLVFDKLPTGMSEYRIDPVGSEPSN